jgi:hypothetical protein
VAATSTLKTPAGKPVIFFHGDKGGVGKSFACASFLDTLIKKGRAAAAVVDGDPSNPDVQRMFEDSFKTKTANLSTHEGWMDLNDFMAENSDLPIVVSMPAGIGRHFKREADAFFKMAEMLERPVSMFWVINRLPDSVNLLSQTLDVVDARLSAKIVVKNLFFGDADKFSRWDNSSVRKRFESLGGKTIALPELHERVVDKLLADNEAVMPFSKAVVPIKEASKSLFKLSPSENMELYTWLQGADSVFAPFHAELGV